MKATALLTTMAIAAMLGAAACEKYDDNPTGTNTTTNPPVTTPDRTTSDDTRIDPVPSQDTTDADNTARNRNDQSPTPMEQGQSETDIRITAEIRRAIMDDSAMSVDAQNCKVITQNGVVTLRGPVASEAERSAIEAKAKAVADVARVDNQLEIKID